MDKSEIPNIESEALDVRPLNSESNLPLCPHCVKPLGQRWTKLKFVLFCGDCVYGFDVAADSEVKREDL